MVAKVALFLIRGLPGSGKSTLAKQIATYFYPSCHLEADQYFMRDGVYQFDATKLGKAHGYCQYETRKALELGKVVIVSNTFTLRSELEPYFDMALEFDIIPQIILCQGSFGSIHNVPDDAMARMQKRFQFDIHKDVL
jgi:predicted kinase